MVDQEAKQVQTPQEAGLYVAQHRRKLGRSLEEATAVLNIPLRQLAAMEEGDFTVFAAEVYARGAYAAYAEWLGLDKKLAQRMVLRVMASDRKVVPLKLHTPHTWLERLVTPRLVLLGASTLLAVIVGGYIVWQLRSFWQLPALALVRPETSYVAEDTVLIQGVSEKDALVTVNGEQLLLRDDQTFELEMALRPGINVVRVEAENAAGRVRVVEKHLLRPRDTGIVN